MAEGIRRSDHAITFYPQNLALTSPTSGGHSVFIVILRAKATELLVMLLYIIIIIWVSLFAFFVNTALLPDISAYENIMKVLKDD
jgi:hypothetical protein